MNGSDELRAWLDRSGRLDGRNRPMRMRLAKFEQDLTGVLLPQKVVGGESICGGVDYDIWCVSANVEVQLKNFLGLPVAIDLVTDQGQLRSICGIVTEAAAGDSDGGLATYKLRIRDAMAIAEMRVRTRIFRDMNEAQIVDQIISEWRAANSVFACALSLEYGNGFHAREYPSREFTMQYNESDAAFVRRLLKRRGISWFFRAEATAGAGGNDRPPQHTLVLFNHINQLQRNASGTVRYHLGGASEGHDTVVSWGSVRKLQPGRVERFSWDYKQPMARHAMVSDVAGRMKQGAAGDALAFSLEDCQTATPHIGNDRDDLCRLGELRMDRKEFESKCFIADCTVRTFCTGEYFTLTGHPEIDRHSAAERDFVITAFSIDVRNNLPAALALKVERLFARCGAWQQERNHTTLLSDQGEMGGIRCHARITAVRRGVPIVPEFDAHSDVPHPPPQSAIVIGPPGDEVHCDSMGRVLLDFPGARRLDRSREFGYGTDKEAAQSAYVRVATNWAGNGPGSMQQCGTLGVPRIGTEVMVTFLDGDPDKPIVTGQLYNGYAEPPALSQRGGLPGNRHLSGIRSREVGGSRGNQLRLDDSNGRINAQLASDHGSSQLNLGFLVHPLAQGYGEARGQGVELRTDHAAALRGGNGVLVSAKACERAEGGQLDSNELSRLLDELSRLSNQLSKLAATHSLDDAAGPHLKQLAERVEQLGKGGAQIVALSGPNGVVAGSGQNIAIGAQTDIDLLSVGNTSASAGEHILLRAALSISLFANELGVKLIASKGPVRLQAQSDSLEVLAKKVVEIISSTDWINIKAKQGVRIYGGGSELEISAAGIKAYTGGNVEMYAVEYQFNPKQARATQFPGEIPHHEVCLPCMLKAAKAHGALVEAK